MDIGVEFQSNTMEASGYFNSLSDNFSFEAGRVLQQMSLFSQVLFQFTLESPSPLGCQQLFPLPLFSARFAPIN